VAADGEGGGGGRTEEELNGGGDGGGGEEEVGGVDQDAGATTRVAVVRVGVEAEDENLDRCGDDAMRFCRIYMNPHPESFCIWV